MNKKKVFISGPMSGYENYNREAFEKAEKELVQAGYSVFNPAWLLFDESWTHYDIMAIDLAALERCDYIYQLEGWENSKGAMEEWSFARLNGIKVLRGYESATILKLAQGYDSAKNAWLNILEGVTNEDERDLIAEYCNNDILATEAVINRLTSDTSYGKQEEIIFFDEEIYDERS